MKIVTVIPLKKAPLKGDLTYFSLKEVSSGDIVSVPIRNKNTLGLVVYTEDASHIKADIKKMAFNLKKISDVKQNSIFQKEYLEACIQVSTYFVSNKNNVIAYLIPTILREKYDEIAKFVSIEARPSMLGLASPSTLKSEKLIFQAGESERIDSYKTMIRESFALKNSVFLVLPTEIEIEKFYKLLSPKIEQFSFRLHSGISQKKILETLKNIYENKHPIFIIGTAPFLAINCHNLKTIVLENESSHSYHTLGNPYMDLRVFVEIFASKINAKLIRGDTILSFEIIGRSEIENTGKVANLSYRTNFDGEIEIYGRSTENLGAELPLGSLAPKFQILTTNTIKEIEKKLAKTKNIFIFSLRKGLATMTVCRDCGEMVSCEKCEAPMVLYNSNQGKKRMFACNRCHHHTEGDQSCVSCTSWNLVPLGIGTDTVYEEVQKLFPKTQVFKLDKESAKSKKGAEKIIKDFEESNSGILVGTEMAFAYMNEKVSLSIIASFDSLWSIPNYKMSEKIIKIITSITSKTTEKLIIQTKNENDRAILALKSGNLLSFIRNELEDRKSLGYPPFKRFIKITHLGDKIQTTRAREYLKENLKEYNPEIFSGFVERLKGKYITNVLLRLDIKDWSLKELSSNSNINEKLYAKLSTLPQEFNITVDPEDLL